MTREKSERESPEGSKEGGTARFEFLMPLPLFLNLFGQNPEKKNFNNQTEASLSGLDPLLASLRRKASRADAAILEALREQCSGFVEDDDEEEEEEKAKEEGGGGGEADGDGAGENNRDTTKTKTVGASLAAAARAAASLSLRVSDVGAKAAASEALVDDICRDVRALDAAKRNLSRGIAALRRLGMLSAATDQLAEAASRGDLGEAARLMGAVNELGEFFAPHAAAVPAVAELSARAAALRRSLSQAALREFELWPVSEVEAGRQPEAPLLDRLRDAGALADAVGREARTAALEAVVSKELGVYRQIFYFNPSSLAPPPSSSSAASASSSSSSASTALERTERRFAWLRKRLRSRSKLWAALPRAWRPDEALAAAFGTETARQLAAVLSAQAEATSSVGGGGGAGGSSASAPSAGGGLSQQQQQQGRVEALLLAVKACNDWEVEMADAFGGPRAAGAEELDFEAEGGPTVGTKDGGRRPAGDDTVSASEVRARAEAAARARAEAAASARAEAAAAAEGESSSTKQKPPPPPSSSSSTAVVPFKGMITSVFEPYLSLYVAAEERALAATAAALVRQEPWTLPSAASAAKDGGENEKDGGAAAAAAASSASSSSGGGLVLRSAPELFAAVKRSLTRCARHVSRGPSLVSLSGAFGRVLHWYSCALAEKIPKPALPVAQAPGGTAGGGAPGVPGGMALAGASAVVGNLVAAAATAASAAGGAVAASANSATLAPLPAPRALLRQLRPPALGSTDWLVRASDADLRRLAAVAATSEYCARVSRELAASVERTVEGGGGGGGGGRPSKNGGGETLSSSDSDATAEAFDDTLALALATAHLAIESRLEAALGTLARSPAWADPALSVVDASLWASDAERGLRAAAAALAPTLRRGGSGLAVSSSSSRRRRQQLAEDNSSHWRYVCDKAAASFGPRLLDGIHRCRKLSEPGCQQLLLDVGVLKAAFLALPNAALPSNDAAAASILAAALSSDDDERGGGGGALPLPPRSFAAAVVRAFGPAEALLKVVGAATTALADSFAALVPGGGTRELSRILELKAGLKRGDAAAVLDAFVAGGGGGNGVTAAAAVALPSLVKPAAAAASSSPQQQKQPVFYPSPPRAPQQHQQGSAPSPPSPFVQQQQQQAPRSPLQQQQPFPSPPMQQQQVATRPQRESFYPPSQQPTPPPPARTPAAAAAADLAARIRARVGAVGSGGSGNNIEDGGGTGGGAAGEAGRRMRDAAAAVRERLSLRDLPFGRNARAARQQQQEEEERQRQQQQQW